MRLSWPELKDRRTYTVLLIPHGESGTRSFSLPYTWLRLGGAALAAFATFLLLVSVTWWYLAAQAARVPGLKRQVAELEAQRSQLAELAQQLEQLEGNYEQVRRMMAGDLSGETGFLWLPPTGRPGSGALTRLDAGRPGPPTSWPLTVRGYITRALLADATGAHPGIDIAVPADSYVRAAGGGTVIDVGRDAIYGRFVLIEHADGYRTLYGHASQTFVARGAFVNQNEVIALSGSTGRSTAPHLHFEVIKDGEPVDPLQFVKQP